MACVVCIHLFLRSLPLRGPSSQGLVPTRLLLLPPLSYPSPFPVSPQSKRAWRFAALHLLRRTFTPWRAYAAARARRRRLLAEWARRRLRVLFDVCAKRGHSPFCCRRSCGCFDEVVQPRPCSSIARCLPHYGGVREPLCTRHGTPAHARAPYSAGPQHASPCSAKPT